MKKLPLITLAICLVGLLGCQSYRSLIGHPLHVLIQMHHNNEHPPRSISGPPRTNSLTAPN